MTPTPPLNKLERVSRELQQVFMSSPNRWPSNGLVCHQKPSSGTSISSLSHNNTIYEGHPYILKLPLEILQTAAELLPAPGDAINLACAYWHHTRTKYPEIDFPENLKATCSSHNPCFHRPLIRIPHAVQIIEEKCIPSLPTFKTSCQPDHRFLSKWNFRLSKLQELGISIVLLTNFLTDFYTRLYTDFHTLKSPSQFRHFIEMRFLEIVSDPTTHFRSRYPRDLYEMFYTNVVRLTCFRSSPYKVLSAETAVSTGDILYELLGNNVVTSSFYPSTKKPLLLSRWIKDYVSDHPEKGFRARTCLGRFTWCCFCRSGLLDGAGESAVTDDHLHTLSETAYSRQGLAEHIFKYHNHRFAQMWEWCPVQ
ncbi:uncharacterized protein DFL_003098 [Arthrobotrys flagrans]|uniref:Uncharacterized protein n=1 Tax=Arthrobotrys flagrans TaxID=97331 RepID=A0A437ACF4_ARTFL|nr:hypothetical protein DFL_003098 [Arthrobotrys flagrans]